MTSISTNQELRQGECLTSSDGKSKAVFEENGNFVVYHWRPIWSTQTAGKGGFRILVQEDQNLVMYNMKEELVWASKTSSPKFSPRMRLTMTNMGALFLSTDRVNIWNSPVPNEEQI